MTERQVKIITRIVRNIDKLVNSKGLISKSELKDVLYLYVQLPLYELITKENE